MKWSNIVDLLLQKSLQHCLDLKWLQKWVLTQPLLQDYTLREYISCGSWRVIVVGAWLYLANITGQHAGNEKTDEKQGKRN